MEGVHGVDVSWTHHQGDKTHAKPRPVIATKSPSTSQLPSPPPSPTKPDLVSQATVPTRKDDTSKPAADSLPAATVAVTQPQPIPQKSRRPSMRSKSSQEKLAQSPETPSKRPGWMQSLSSKFGSSKGSVNPIPSPGSSGIAKSPPSSGQSNAQSTVLPKPEDGMEPYVPQQPESGSFFQSALRRLSTANQSSQYTGQTTGKSGMCPRMVLNVDDSRRRCVVKELNPSKLRRVAFSVDVEIAGGSQYTQEPDPAAKEQKAKDKRVKERSEGEALKRPMQAAAFFDEIYGESDSSKEALGAADAAKDGKLATDGQKPPEAQTAATSQAPQDSAQADKTGNQAQVSKETSTAENGMSKPETATTSAPKVTSSRPHDRPTTDPVRMYRRCCQLREAPVLKRISEQLSNPTRCGLEPEGIVGCLDLRGSRMQLQDIVCLGDWLAIVPLRKLLLDNANLTDEGLRFILAGLLAAKPPEMMRKRKRGRSSPSEARAQPTQHTPGVIEKLTLKNNPKITVEGWRYICTFLNMSRSIKAIDVSMIPFPKFDAGDAASIASDNSRGRSASTTSKGDHVDMAEIIFKAIAERAAGSQLDELTMCECGLSTRDVRKIVDAATVSGLSILGLAKNNLDEEAIQHAVRMLRSKTCKGLDLGGNDLRNAITIIAESLAHGKDNPLWGLSLADCNLEPTNLLTLFPALVTLPNFRFIDLSHNRELFSSTPSAQSALRKYLPQLKWLRRVHLNDVSMSPAQAIGLAEILPEVRNLSHVSLLENPQLKELADTGDPKLQEDACALYASLMVAVRVSKLLVAIDIDAPGEKTNEVVQAIHKQLTAYSLRNIDRFTALDAVQVHDPAGLIPDVEDNEDTIMLPDVILHLVGPNQNPRSNHEGDSELGPDEDYLVGGTGVVKALSYCLSEKSRANTSGTGTPSEPFDSATGRAEAKEMSKSLLGSARKIRARLQDAMAREQKSGDEWRHRRLQFLDQTLQGIIERFESEYPSCREIQAARKDAANRASCLNSTEPVEPPSPPRSRHGSNTSTLDSADAKAVTTTGSDSHEPATSPPAPNGSGSGSLYGLAGSRRASETSLASKALAREEGTIHRFGQRVRRDLLPPAGTTDHLHGTSTQDPAEAEHLRILREKLEQLDSNEVREKVVTQGLEATFREWDGLARSASAGASPVVGARDAPGE
ncbi:hypothetical protein FH972_021861 [Carpinus fangiana]|uniref:RNI-like protein n=1 Tax=Carpinus fangiana TaxID=176857 RepID=A0A5N6KSN9_9ROSI|nr:hypothetical protein FH972_021861 [Carpinus fangiana]